MIEIEFNLQVLEIQANSSLQALLEQQQASLQGIAVVLNGQLVPKQRWLQTFLSARDQVKVFRAIAGG